MVFKKPINLSLVEEGLMGLIFTTGPDLPGPVVLYWTRESKMQREQLVLCFWHPFWHPHLVLIISIIECEGASFLLPEYYFIHFGDVFDIR